MKNQILIPSNSVFSARPEATNVSHSYVRFVQLCDGNRTLLDIALDLRLPLNVCSHLAAQAVQNGYVAPCQCKKASEDACELWNEVMELMINLLGGEGASLIAAASKMTGLPYGKLPLKEILNFSIALEISADEWSRDLIAPHLDAFSQFHAA